jgi:hypothetical protein
MRRTVIGLVAALASSVSCSECNPELQNLVAQGRLDPAVYNFGVVKVGATCTTKILLWDDGQQDLTVSGARMEDDNSGGAFSITAFPSVVSAGGEDEVTVQYRPTAESNGMQSATLVMLTSDPDNNGKVIGQLAGEASNALAGKILPTCRAVEADAADTVPCTTVDFGGTPKLDPGSQGGVGRHVMVTNDGTAPFNIVAVNVLPAEGSSDAPEFALDLVNNVAVTPSTFPLEVLPSRGGDCGERLEGAVPRADLWVMFRPTRVGVQGARLQVITDATTAGTPGGVPAGQSHVSLTGIASGVGLAITPGFVPFGSVAAGSTKTEEVRVANLDIHTATVNTTCIDMNGNGTCYQDPGCTTGCATDPEDVDCTGGDPDAATGLNCDVVSAGKGFVLQPTDAAAGGADEVTMTVTWSPTSAMSFSKNLLLMTTIGNMQVYSVRLTGGVAGRINVSPGSLMLRLNADTVGATGSGTFTVLNDGQADLTLSRIRFQGSASITDDYTMTRAGDPAFSMGCTRGPTDLSCPVTPWTTPIVLTPNQSTVFTLTYTDNDEVMAMDSMDVSLEHDGNGQNPAIVSVEVCKPGGADGGGSNRPVCP